VPEQDDNHKNQSFYRRLGFAVAGLCETWRRERSFRAQIVVAVLVVVALVVIRPPSSGGR
jgi:diacylglycerol kinase